MRLFIAVAAGAQAQAAAASAILRLRRVPGDYRWVDPRDMHVTLRFLGETPEEKLPEVEVLMRHAAAQAAPFELTYGGVGAFDSMEDPRVVWVGLQDGAAPMASLAKLLGRDEPRPYAPHLTLGRRRGTVSTPEFGAALKAEPVVGLKQSVTKISLYASRPAPFGHAYEILLEVDLTG
jgi:2'-5' RNA ligase